MFTIRRTGVWPSAARARARSLLTMAVAVVALGWPVSGAIPGAILPRDTQDQASGTGVVAGQIVDATSTAAVGGSVVTLAVSAGPGQPPIPAARARRGVAVTGADGRFVFRGVPAGTYTITSTRAGYAPGATDRRRPNGPAGTVALAEGQRLSNITIPMWPLASIAGSVFDDRGEPVIGVGIWAMRRVMDGGRVSLSSAGGTVDATDERGRFRLNNLMPGSYVVSHGMAVQSVSVSTVDGFLAMGTPGRGPVRPEFIGTGAIQMAEEGLVIDGWQVSVSNGRAQPLPGPDGTLLIHPSLFYPGVRSPADAAIVRLDAGDHRSGIDLTLPLVAGTRVSGVLDGPGGPAANHGVRLTPVSLSEPAMSLPIAYATTDAAGRFTLLGVPPGTYRLTAQNVPPSPEMRRFLMGQADSATDGPPPRSLFAEVPVTVGSGPVTDLSMTLRPGARLAGRIAFDGSAAPPDPALVSRTTVTIQGLSGDQADVTVRVDGQGAFETNGHAPGRYLATISFPGARWTLSSLMVGAVDAAGQAFTLGTEDVDHVVVTFTDVVTTLTGTVRGTQADDDLRATILAVPADTRRWILNGMSPVRMASATASSSGTYQLQIPLPGDYVVIAVPPDVAPAVDPEFVARFFPLGVRVTFARGETKTQPLTLARPGGGRGLTPDGARVP